MFLQKKNACVYFLKQELDMSKISTPFILKSRAWMFIFYFIFELTWWKKSLYLNFVKKIILGSKLYCMPFPAPKLDTGNHSKLPFNTKAKSTSRSVVQCKVKKQLKQM